MIVDVIPFRRSFGAQPISYSIPKNITSTPKVGSLVYVPWRNDEDIALVVRTHEQEPDYELKDICRLEYSESILDPIEIALLFSIAKRFLLPLHKVLQLFIPLPILSRFERKSYLDTSPSVWTPETNIAHTYEHLLDEKELIQKLHTYTQAGSSVIIVPHAFMIESIQKKIEQNVTIDTPHTTPAKQFHAYQDISRQANEIVIGTRKVLFRRIGAYKNIIHLDDGIGTDLHFFQYKLDAYWIHQQLAHFGKNTHTLTTNPKIKNLYQSLKETTS